MAVDMIPQSRDEEILIATINGNEYTAIPQSRMEYLLLAIKSVIEEGQGTLDYESLENKPQINSVTLIGDMSASDLGLETSPLTTEQVNQLLDVLS